MNPWIEALRADRLTLDPGLRDRLGAATGAELVRVFPELSTPDEQPAIAGAQHALLFDALVELIGAEAAEHPIVLVIEDLHWADAMSARFLAYFGRRVHRLPVLLVGSMRPEDLLDAPTCLRRWQSCARKIASTKSPCAHSRRMRRTCSPVACMQVPAAVAPATGWSMTCGW